MFFANMDAPFLFDGKVRFTQTELHFYRRTKNIKIIKIVLEIEKMMCYNFQEI